MPISHLLEGLPPQIQFAFYHLELRIAALEEKLKQSAEKIEDDVKEISDER